MKIIQRFSCQASPDVHSLLEANHIQYTLTLFPGNREYTVFDIPEDDPAFFELVHKHNLRPSSISKVLFSKQEMDEAQWFTCWATSPKIELDRHKETFQYREWIDHNRVRHRYLIGKPFYLKKPVKHRPEQHFFFSYELSFSHIFCDDYAMRKLAEVFDEISFQPTFHAKTGLPIEDLHYMHIEKELNSSSIILPPGNEQFCCPVCGEVSHFPPIQLEINADSLDSVTDICRTASIFGYGGNFCHYSIIISKHFYQFLQENRMSRGLEFRPVILRDDTNEEAFLPM